MEIYGPEFYERQSGRSLRSAECVVPVVLGLLPETKSVVDVGCGVGTWLSVFEGHGIVDTLGLDGPYVRQTDLRISPERFRATNLTGVFDVPRRFDLAICLEVAEHLPKTRSADFVSDLTELSDTVLFSAAIPGQGGQQHVNEAWPSFWIPLFEQQGFGVSDSVRSKIWDMDDIAWYYRQNILLFEKGSPSASVNDVVHPEMLSMSIRKAGQPGLRYIPSVAVHALREAFRARIGQRPS